jgi:hypothetical protein
MKRKVISFTLSQRDLDPQPIEICLQDVTFKMGGQIFYRAPECKMSTYKANRVIESTITLIINNPEGRQLSVGFNSLLKRTDIQFQGLYNGVVVEGKCLFKDIDYNGTDEAVMTFCTWYNINNLIE